MYDFMVCVFSSVHAEEEKKEAGGAYLDETKGKELACACNRHRSFCFYFSVSPLDSLIADNSLAVLSIYYSIFTIYIPPLFAASRPFPLPLHSILEYNRGWRVRSQQQNQRHQHHIQPHHPRLPPWTPLFARRLGDSRPSTLQALGATFHLPLRALWRVDDFYA